MAASGREGRPKHPVWHGGLLVLVCAVAFGAGFVQALDQHSRQAGLTAQDAPAGAGGNTVPSCRPPDGATVTDTLTIHARAQPITYDLAETIVVPVVNPSAGALMTMTDQTAYDRAWKCLFPMSLGRPALVSVADGVATFTAGNRQIHPSRQGLRRGQPALTEWQAVLSSHGVRLTFDQRAVCPKEGTYVTTNWADSALTLTVVSDTSPSWLTPPPDSVRGQSYSWTRSIAICPDLPRIDMMVPAGFAGHLSTLIYASVSPDGLAGQLIGWSVPVIDTLIAIGLCLLWLRDQRLTLRLMGLAALGVGLAAVDLGFVPHFLPHGGITVGFGPAELLAAYGCALFLVLDPRPALWRGLLAAAVAAAAAFIAATRNESWFSPWLLLASALLACALAVISGIVFFRRARRAPFYELARQGGASPASVTDIRDRAMFWLGAAFAVAFAYSLGTFDTYSTTFAASSELITLRFVLLPAAVVLIAVALVIPLARQGPWAERGAVAAAAFGWATVAQLPQLFVFGIRFPLGAMILAGLVSALAWRNPAPPVELYASSRIETCQPRPGLAANTTLAIDIAAVLAVIPVGYYIYATHLSAQLTEPGPGPAFAVGSVLQQLAGWVLAGLVYAMLRLRLPGKVGPLRALALSAAWFGAAAAVQLSNDWTQPAGGWAWTFPGLELLLFLVTFGVLWDLYTLKQGTWKQAVTGLREAYDIKQARAVALYAVPVLVAVVTIGQQLASGTALDFVKSVLNLPLSLLP